MKLTKTEQKRKEMLNFMIENLPPAEKSCLLPYDYERKKGKIIQELRNITLKELGI